MKIELTNDFHNTRCYILMASYWDNISSNQIKRAKSKLCGIKDCQCSNNIGIRGRQFDNNRREFFIEFFQEEKNNLYGVLAWKENNEKII